MNRLEAYITRKEEIIESSGASLEREKQRKYIAEEILRNIKNLKSMSNDELTLRSNIERGDTFNFFMIDKNPDPVCAKMMRAVNFVYQTNPKGGNNPYVDIAPMIAEHVMMLYEKMKDRRMTWLEYEHLDETSTKGVLDGWSEDIRHRLEEGQLSIDGSPFKIPTFPNLNSAHA